MKIYGAIQARMSSQRLPDKVLCKIKNKPVLRYVLENVKNCKLLQGVVVATSIKKEDNRIVDFCNMYGVDCCRGSLDDVASRFKDACEIYHLDAFVRINADSPLLDWRLIDKAVEIFMQGGFDIVTNIQKRTYPKGQSVEVVSSDFFRNKYELIRDSEDMEHVTSYFYKNPCDFRIFNFSLDQDYSNINLSLDTHEDLKMITSIIRRMDKPHWHYELKEILEIWREISLSQDKTRIGI